MVTPAAPPAVASTSPVGAAPPALPASEPASGPQNPVEALAPPEAALPALAGSDDPCRPCTGRTAGLPRRGGLLQMDGLVRRVVATVDNLGREHAPARLWPVNPHARTLCRGRQRPGANHWPRQRRPYGALVRWIESVTWSGPWRVCAALSLVPAGLRRTRLPRPLFQRPPGGGDRPSAPGSRARQPRGGEADRGEGRRAVHPPWVRYEFADPQLQNLSSGQKIMVRVGLENERRLKARLKALRALVATGRLPRPNLRSAGAAVVEDAPFAVSALLVGAEAGIRPANDLLFLCATKEAPIRAQSTTPSRCRKGKPAPGGACGVRRITHCAPAASVRTNAASQITKRACRWHTRHPQAPATGAARRVGSLTRAIAALGPGFRRRKRHALLSQAERSDGPWDV